MSKKTHQEKLLQEIQYVAGPIFNIQRGTATEREKQIVQECLGYLSLLNYSVLTPKEIYRLWEESNLVYQ